MKPACCPHCQRPMLPVRLGAQLTPLKARIFDLVHRAGTDGIEHRQLFDLAFSNALPKPRTQKTVKSHVWQINDAIADSGFRICGHGGFYRLIGGAAE